MTDLQYTARKASRMLGLNLHAWEILMVFSLVAVAVAAVFVVALTRKEASEIKRAYDTYKLTVDAKVAEAKAEGIKAGETAGNALFRAATLEKEAAKLTKEVEEAKLVLRLNQMVHTARTIMPAIPAAVSRWSVVGVNLSSVSEH